MNEHAELITEAAALLRQRAEYVQHFPSPWRSEPGPDDSWQVLYATDNPSAGLIATTPDYGQDALPDFIAAMSPELALAFAEWLETEARMCAIRGNSAEGQTFHALKVARSLLYSRVGQAPAA